MSKKKLPKRKIKINIEILKRPFLLTAVTLAIIVIGLGIPMVLLSLQTRQAALPKGEVAVDEIQPYGADVLEMETAIIGSIKAAFNIGSYNDYTYLNTLLEDPPGTKTATAENCYGELDLKDKSRKDLNHELFYESYSLIQENFGGALPSQVTISTIQDTGDASRSVILVTAVDTDDYAILDPSTGVPVEMMITVISQDRPDLDAFWRKLVDLYSDYMGISLFVDDDMYRYYETSAEYDSWYDNSAITADEKLTLYLSATSGWYWTPPEYDGDDWHSTDNYIWQIYISLYDD